MIDKYSESEFTQLSNNIHDFFTNDKILNYLNDVHEITTMSSFGDTQIYVITVPLVFKRNISTRRIVILVDEKTHLVYDDDLRENKIISNLKDQSNFENIINVFYLLVQEYFSVFDFINIEIAILEASISKNLSTELIISIINFQKKIQNMSVNLEAILDLNNFVIFHNKIVDSNLIYSLEEISIELKQINSMCNAAYALLDNISEGIDSINNYRLNKIMKTLTIATLLLAIPTMIAGIYGMNIPLPFQDNNSTFLGFIVLCLVIVILVFNYFKKKKFW